MPDPLVPDAREQVREFLMSRPAVTAIAGDRIGIALRSGEVSIRIAFVTGSNIAPGTATPLVQVECWGKANTTDDGKASDLARTVVAQLVDFHGTYASGRVAGAAEEGWYASPDQVSNRPRDIVQVRLLSHAALV